MRIAIDVREVANKRAGKGYYAFELVNHLARIDKENEYLLYADKRLSWDLPANFKIRVLAGRGLWLQFNLMRAVRKDRADLFLAALSYLSAILARVPTVLVVHDLAVFYAPVRSKLKSRLLERLTLGLAVIRAKKILTISRATADDLLRFNPTLKEKIAVTLLAAAKRFRVQRKSEILLVLKKYNLAPGYLLFVGTLEPRKNIVLILEAYAKFSRSLQCAHPLVLAGKKGWYYDEIFLRLKELGLENNVRFLDYVAEADLPYLYNGAALFLFPSLYEGFGLPVLEALQSGVPTIISQTPALIEIGGGAAVVTKFEAEDFSAKIEKILTDDDFRARLIDKSLKYVQKYDWLKTAKETLKIMEEHGDSG